MPVFPQVRTARRCPEPSTADDGTSLRPVPGAEFAEIPVDAIRPNPRQPRTVFDEDDMAELVHSIREIGVLQPIVVRPAPGAARRRGPLRAHHGRAALAGLP